MGQQPSSSSRAPTPSSSANSNTSSGVTPSHGPHGPVAGVGGASQLQAQLAALHVHGHDRVHLSPTARRRESIQALASVLERDRKATAAPPSLVDATGTAAARPISRGRSHTISASSTTQHAFVHVANTLRAHHHDDKMGNDQSRPKHARHDLTPPKQPPPPAHNIPPAQPAPPAPVAPVAAPQADDKGRPLPSSPHTRPVDVPAVPGREDHGTSRTDAAAAAAAASSIEPADASLDAFIVPSSHYSRPPRLPLPIEEQLVTPGSPIFSPADLTNPIHHDEGDGSLPRRTSMLSERNADDDDLADEFKGPQGQLTVPTLIEWEGPGERVYVTGTFAGWERKYQLHPNGPSKKKDILSAYVHITPGTHHLMFIVDNDMKTSDKLPTAVDYTNILVNYLEVSLDDVPKTEAEIKEDAKKAEAAPVPVEQQQAPSGVTSAHVRPEDAAPLKKPEPEPKPKARAPSPKRYHQNIPRYLFDLDAPEDSRRFTRANAAGGHLPTPPSLPMFLSKSILNGTTPMKDDSSVLIMPNHTVLNHLATSSIKDNILATSATTRYKQKFLTTIMYKPRNEDPDY